MSDLSKLIAKNAGTYGADTVMMLVCSVDSVSEDTRSCMVTPINNNIASFPARLMTETDDGVLILPTVGSTVKILFSSLNAPTVIQFSEIDKIFLVAGGSTSLIHSGGLELDGNKFFGLVKVKELTDKINNLENIVNDLIGKFNSHTHIVVTSAPAGTWTSATGLPQETDTLTPTQQSDIENPQVKHGDGS